MMYGQQQQQVHQFQKQTKMDPHHVSRTVGGVGDNRTKPTEEGEERRMRRRLDDVIDLSGMSLDSLPNTRINLAAITELDLSNNDLQLIPESLMARLLNLIVLDVHSNQLKCLPNSIGCLSKLKLLNVSGNLLEYLPKTIEHCRSLEEMNANFNKLKRLPETIGFELINLKKLSINSNRIGLLPQSISHLTALRVLDARLNCLRYMPDDLENLINLQVLNISQNFQHLETLPYSVGLLLSLVELDVSYNTITALPNSLGCLHKLQKLSLEGNPLVSPPPEVVERGLKATKIYLSEKMNSDDHQSPKKNSWVGKWVRYGTLNGSTIRNIISRSDDDQERDRFITSDFGEIDSLAVPRRQPGMFSPRRLFSSQCYSAKS